MRRLYLPAAGSVTVALLITLSGCGSSATPKKPSAAKSPGADHTPAKTEADHDHGDHQHGQHEHGEHGHSDMSKMKANFASLSAADRASAEAQHFCPVSGEMLGADGPPIKMRVKNRDVWICCESCREKILSSPDKYLAKLKN